MVMQGISPPGEKLVVDLDSIGTGVDTTVCMMGGRFCIFTIKLATKLSTAGDITLDLKCGGSDSNLLPTTANMTITFEGAKDDVILVKSADMTGYQTFQVSSISGASLGTLTIEPMWC